jgi:hypothetical protein
MVETESPTRRSALFGDGDEIDAVATIICREQGIE